MTALRPLSVSAPADIGEFQQFALDRGWGDGLPLIPPTPDRVAAMLAGTDRDPGEVLGLLPTTSHECTIERLAVCAVLAGCLPAHLPVLITVFEAALEPRFNMLAVQATTHPVGVMVLVNGPIARTLGINGGVGAMGPGNRANATIGRAVRLAQNTVGGAEPGTTDLSTQGSPLKYGFCVAENEAASPWPPFHVSAGFDAQDSVVTVHAAESPNQIGDHVSADATGILLTFANTIAVMGKNNSYSAYTEYFVGVSPETAAVLHRAGMGRADLQQFLYERARIPKRLWRRGGSFGFMRVPTWVTLADDDALVPMSSSPDRVKVFVLGGGADGAGSGGGRHNVWFPSFGSGRSVSAVVRGASGEPWRPY